MITFINESLFSKVIEKRNGKDGAPDYYRTIVTSAMPVLGKGNSPERPKVIEHILHTEEDNFNKINTEIHMKWMDGRGIVRLNQKPANETDTQVYLIAIPYNGFIAPIERSDKFQIYKGLTVTLNQPLKFENNRYKHIAYITLVPTTKDQPCTFVVEGFSTRRIKDEKKTFKTTWTIEVRATDPVYSINSETVVVEPVDFESKKTIPLFPLIQKPEPKKIQRDRKPPKKPYNKEKKFTGNGTNSRKDSNRPSKPNNTGGKRQNNKKNMQRKTASIGTPVVSKSLDEMIRECELARQEKQRRRNGKKRRGRR